MNFEISPAPFSTLRIQLNQGEKIYNIPGSLVSYYGNLKIKNKIAKGRSFKKWLATLFGKSIFQQEITPNEATELIFRPEGTHIIPIKFSGEKVLLVSPDNYFLFVGLDYEVIWFNYNPFLKFSGEGILFLSSFGDLIEVELLDNQSYRINDDYLVAFETSVKFIDDWNWKGLKNSVVSGTDYILLEGKGKFWLQSRENLSKSGSSGSILGSVWRIFE